MKPRLWSSIVKALLPTDKNQGFSLVESILASAVFGLLVTALVGAYIYGSEASALAGKRVQANFLLAEELEAVRNLRDANFTNLVDGTYGLAISANKWTLSGTSDTTEIFTRSITIASVDATRKLITATVNWTQNAQRTATVTAQTYLTNWARMILTWFTPRQVALLNLTGNYAGVKIKIIGNYAYIVRTGGNDFVVVDISNPIVPVEVGAIVLNGTPSDLFISGSYAYLSSNHNTQELQIVNIANPTTPTLAASYNDTGNEDATGIYVTNNIAYLILNGGDTLVTINVANPLLPTKIGSIALSGGALDVLIDGSYAYLASNNNSQELQLVNIANPATPAQVSSLNITGNSDMQTIVKNNNTLALGRVNGDIAFINITNPLVPTLLATLSAGNNINDLYWYNNLLFTATATSNQQFQCVDATTITAPTLRSFVNLTNTANGIFYNSTQDRVYVVGTNNNSELRVIAPQ